MGKWIETNQAQPTRYGKYNVLVKRRNANTPDVYLWNGSYWVTPGGSPSHSVLHWYDTDAEDDSHGTDA